ncbi:MAG: PAS domain S-box protein, partial [Acidobacteria bacterium]|nr:PAS domain S-box protein [Acidobacteriota bacterium]
MLLPIHLKGEVAAIIGLADRPGGYTPAMVEWLSPITALTANLLSTRKLEQAERELDAYFTHSRVIHIVMNSAGRFVRVNPAFSKLLGLSERRACSRHFCEFIHPDDIEKSKQEYLAVLSGKHCEGFENRYRAADGSFHWIQWRVPPPLAGSDLLFATGIDITENRKLQQEMHLLATLARRTNNAVVVTNAQGEIEWVNEGFTLLTGYGHAEVLGRKPGSFLQGPETDQSTIALMRERLLAGEGFQVEVLNYAKDGRKYWLEVEVQPIFDSKGKLTHFMAIELDITARKLSDQKLQDSERLLQDASAMTKVGGWEIDLKRGLPIWSEEVYRIHEVPLDYQPTLEEAIAFYPPGAREAISNLVTRSIETGTAWDVEMPLITSKGREIWVRSVGRPEFRDGKCTRLVGSFQDISERRKREDQLRRSEARNRALIAALPDYLLQVNEDFEIIAFHDAEGGSPHFPLRDSVGLNLKDVLTPELWQRVAEACEAIGVEGSSEVVHYEHFLD